MVKQNNMRSLDEEKRGVFSLKTLAPFALLFATNLGTAFVSVHVMQAEIKFLNQLVIRNEKAIERIIDERATDYRGRSNK